MQIAKIHELKGFIFDLDGVVWKREQVIPGALECIKELRNLGKKVAFITNNSSQTRDGFVAKLCRMGIEAVQGEVVSSLYTAATYLSKVDPEAKVYPVGMPALQKELESAGLKVVVKPEEAQYLVAGYDSQINYEKLGLALKSLLAGAKFIATNDDGLLPTEDGYMPGAGAIIGAIRGMVKREPDLLVGKPNDLVLKLALSTMGLKVEDCAFVGDSLETDIMLANKVKMYSILVMTGNTRNKDEIKKSSFKPDCILSSIDEIANFLLLTKKVIQGKETCN